jgi:hypothetical protein
MINCVFVNIGYAEDASVGHVALVHPAGFDTEAEAIRDLAASLYDKYTDDTGCTPDTESKCCKTTLSKDSEAAYCSKCGSNLRVPKFDPENYEHWLRNIFSGTCDGFGFEIVSVKTTQEWNPWCGFDEIIKLVNAGHDTLDLGFNSEKVLTAALNFYDKIPENSRQDLKSYAEWEFFDDKLKKILGLPKYGSKKQFKSKN